MIAVNEPSLDEADIQNLIRAARSGWISSAGSFIDDFERRWADYCGMSHGIAVSNGTTALDVACWALEIGPGDEVILPSFTIISCISAILLNGATPVLVDADPETWCMDVSQLADRLTSRTRAIMPVHIYGHPVDMNPVLELAARHGLAVIEDAAEAHGAEYRVSVSSSRWARCGGMSDASVFSFYANKLITTGEGGMVLAKDERVAERARSKRNLCFQPRARFVHAELGNNYRLTNLQAALAVEQIERMPAIISKKRWIADQYLTRLSDLPQLQLPVEREWARQVYWMFGVVLLDDVAFDAQELANRLQRAGVETRPFFFGMHEQPVLRDMGLFAGERYPVTERISRRGLYLPSGLALSESQIDEVATAVRAALR